MIRRLLKLFPAVIAALFGTEHQQLTPDAHHTKNLQDLQTLLEPFEQATKLPSSEKSPSASLIMPILHRLICGDCEVTDIDSSFFKRAKVANASDLKKS